MARTVAADDGGINFTDGVAVQAIPVDATTGETATQYWAQAYAADNRGPDPVSALETVGGAALSILGVPAGGTLLKAGVTGVANGISDASKPFLDPATQAAVDALPAPDAPSEHRAIPVASQTAPVAVTVTGTHAAPALSVPPSLAALACVALVVLLVLE